MTEKKINVSVGDVSELYRGPVGKIWELLMGELIHVGGEEETLRLAKLAGVKKSSKVLDICSALGGPARLLAKKFGCQVTGLDATDAMIQEAERRTKKAGLSKQIAYVQGSALDIPFRANSFDIVWGEDAWCYVADKGRLIEEAARVLVPGGVLAFSDWLQKPKAPAKAIERINQFMVFPYVETLEGYAALCKKNGLVVKSAEDLFPHFVESVTEYLTAAAGPLKKKILALIDEKTFGQMAAEMVHIQETSQKGHFGRGRIIAVKKG